MIELLSQREVVEATVWPKPVISVQGLSVRTPSRLILREASFSVQPGQVFALIGPSGAGKTTLLRCINRLTDLVDGLQVCGEVVVGGEPVYGKGIDINALRAKAGMIFQQPVIFPGSIAANVLFGAKRLRRLSRSEGEELIESVLREVALWNEVRDRLKAPALALSVGQQQRLCIARTLAVKPEILLMDEPTSALDPKSTQAIEDLVCRLKPRHTFVLITHNLAQARRIADWIGCVYLRDGAGELVETSPCEEIFCNPQSHEVRDYLSPVERAG
jgi:phosphate transport system ATP-binding protein